MSEGQPIAAACCTSGCPVESGEKPAKSTEKCFCGRTNI